MPPFDWSLPDFSPLIKQQLADAMKGGLWKKADKPSDKKPPKKISGWNFFGLYPKNEVDTKK